MSNSLYAGLVPICLIVVAVSWFIAGAMSHWVHALLSILVPIAISFSWGFLPRVPDMLRPLPFGEDDWMPWIFMAVVAWSAVSVPIGAIAVYLFSRKRMRKATTE